MKRCGVKLVCVGMLMMSAGGVVRAQTAAGIFDVEKKFAAPPDDARPMMRWWWFGPSVTKPELEREILAMKAGRHWRV